MKPEHVLGSIDGVGAFDHVCRARLFERLEHGPALHGLIPSVRQWNATTSRFLWTDDDAREHVISQGNGGEQGDALMPATFCLSVRAALAEIQNRLPGGGLIVAYSDDV